MPTNHNKQKTTIINADDIAGLPTILRDKRDHRLAVVIDDADQTAPGVFERMLKLIEEPVGGVYFIFTTHRISALPATILSRTGIIRVKAPAAEACRSLLSGVDAQLANQITWLAGNRPALTRRLVESGDQSQPDLISMTRAKQFMQAQRPRRIEQIDTIYHHRSILRQGNSSLKFCRPNAIIHPFQYFQILGLLHSYTRQILSCHQQKKYLHIHYLLQ